MISLAVINRYRLTPRIGPEGAAAISAIRRHAMAELALGACVLTLVAGFGQLDPT
jgi:putative copper export protein